MRYHLYLPLDFHAYTLPPSSAPHLTQDIIQPFRQIQTLQLSHMSLSPIAVHLHKPSTYPLGVNIKNKNSLPLIRPCYVLFWYFFQGLFRSPVL